jgi:APA family basic amino acid/polyamine antiporter
MDSLGNPLLILELWFVGGIIAFFGAIAFGERGATFPETERDYIIISKLFNRLHGFFSR